MISPQQCRAARALLGWRMEDLAKEAGVGFSTVADFEAGRRTPRQSSMAAIVEALEKGGVEFIDRDNGGPGVRLRKG